MDDDRTADTTLFAQVYDRHAAELLRYCFRRTADGALAEDLVSVVFLEAWRRRGDRRVDARPWLYGIATNVVRQQRRSRRRHAAALARVRDRLSVVEPPEDVVAREHEMRAVLAAIARLPRREQDVLVLCVWSELSYEQAAVVLGVPVGTVRSRLSRARQRLRDGVCLDPSPASQPERTLP